MPQKSNKAAFVRHVDPDVFVRTERENRPWMRHSVAVLVLSPRVDQTALVLPKKADYRGASNVRVPPQQSLDQSSTVRTTASQVLRELLTVQVKSTELQYLGTGRGDAHNGDAVKRYGKYIHWMGLRLTKTHGVFNSESAEFQFAHWCSANHLLAMDTFAMSDRKYILTLQALVAFNALGAEGTLIRKARERLAA